MKKGFTLVELLGVIIIITTLLLILLPNIINSIKGTENDSDKLKEEFIVSATKLYISDNFSNFSEEGYTYCIPISTLVDGEYLTAPVKYGNIDDISGTKTVKVTFNSTYQYSIVDRTACSTTNYLMIQDQTNDTNSKFFGTDLNKSSIEKVVTLNSINVPDTAINVYDVSELKNDSIKLWYLDQDNNGLYEVYIAQVGGVIANANSKRLFGDLINAEYIDIRNLNTSYVLNMSYMFYNCINLTEVYLDNIVTNKVRDMSYMFSNCSKLPSINLSSFTTENLLSTDKMFENTSLLDTLNLSSADFTNTSSNLLMFKGTKGSINVRIKCSAQNFVYKALANSGIRNYTGTINNPSGCTVIDYIKPFGGTYVAAASTDTHKGTIYLNPKDLTATCNASLAAANVNGNGTPTGIKSGCMKFYIFDDTGDTYKLILDHNTSGGIAWIRKADYTANGGTNYDWDSNEYHVSKGPLTVTAKLNSDTTGWLGEPRLITANEIAHIIGADRTDSIKWDQAKYYASAPTNIDRYSSTIYLDGAGAAYTGWQTSTTSSTVKSRYGWLFDYTYACLQYGCNVQDNNSYQYGSEPSSSEVSTLSGYWLNTSVAGTSSYAWTVSRTGKLYNYLANNNKYFGVRPVITLQKVDIQ